MQRRKVSHKQKKICRTLLSSLELAYGITPGTIFRSRANNHLMELRGEIDKDKVVVSFPEQGWLRPVSIKKDSLLMFIDIIYDPFIKCHFLRLLAGEVLVGFRHKKGRTVARLVSEFEKLDLSKGSTDA